MDLTTSPPEPLVSVIVPTYNGARTLDRALGSVLTETKLALELIVIDDGSTDATSEVLAGWQRSHANLKVYVTPNRGASSARNLGLRKAKGRYLAFLDADDFMLPGGLFRLVSSAVEGEYPVVVGQHRSTAKYRNAIVLSGDEAALEMLYSQRINSAIWARVIKRSLTRDLQFETGTSFAEDLLFNWSILKRSEAVLVLPDIVYQYDPPATSVTRSPVSIAALQPLTVLSNISPEGSPEDLRAIHFRTFVEAFSLLSRLKSSHQKHRDIELACTSAIQDTVRTVIRDPRAGHKWRAVAAASLTRPGSAAWAYAHARDLRGGVRSLRTMRPWEGYKN